AYTHVLTGAPTQFFYTGSGSPTSYSWTFYGAGVNPANSTDPSPEVIYTNDGNYTVRLDVTDADGNMSYEIKSTYILADEFGGTIGITENQLSVNLFPNPSTGIVYLSQNVAKNAEVRVLTVLGKEVYSNTLTETLKIDLSEFKNGVYFIEVKNENSSTTERLILNK
ncbi:T9SS type A sorting domain-containing protein, partial [Flavobacteriales bacterium]|nr:T9SS type A sorting domain-containing protein [Flavobacteriales bacterium]